MKADHDRLDELLRAGAWPEFRGGLLRHIGLEEKILLPEVKRRQGGQPAPEAARLREDHGAIATLLVPTPGPIIVEALLRILGPHNALEEEEGGVYARCDALAGSDGPAIVRRLEAAPEVPMNPYQDGPRAQAQVERVLAWLAAR